MDSNQIGSEVYSQSDSDMTEDNFTQWMTTEDFDTYNTRHNYSEGRDIWFRRPGWEVAVKSIAVIPIMAIGIVGNLAVILFIVKLKSLRKSHINLFILNMALADLLTTLFTPWLALFNEDNVYQNYELGPFFCKFQAFWKMMCLLSSVLSLITISFDRFIAIVYPFKRHLNIKVSYIIMIAIWTLAIILASPLAFWRAYKERQWLDFKEKWCPEENLKMTKLYWLFLMVPLIYLPLIVMIIVYSIIIRHMDRYEKTIAINETPLRLKHSHTIIKMLFIYIITTFICWLPLQIIVFYRRFRTDTLVELPYWYTNVCFIAQLFASANSAINPIITFRKTFAHLLPKLLTSKKVTNRITPMDVAVIQQHIDMARPSLATDSAKKQLRLLHISSSNTTSFTKQIMMKRAPELFMRDDT